MDEKDREILDILEENGRISYTEIAREIGVSEGTVRNRVDRMLEDGTIERFTVDVSRNGISAVVLVKLSMGADPGEIIEKFPGGMTVLEVTGEHDLVLLIDRGSTEELNNDLDELRGVEGVEETVTKSVLKKRRLEGQ